MNSSALKNWLQRGELEKLENIVLEGRGARLLGEHSQDLRTRVFLKGLPNYLVRKSQRPSKILPVWEIIFNLARFPLTNHR